MRFCCRNMADMVGKAFVPIVNGEDVTLDMRYPVWEGDSISFRRINGVRFCPFCGKAVSSRLENGCDLITNAPPISYDGDPVPAGGTETQSGEGGQ